MSDQSQGQAHRAWLELSSDALRHNVEQVRQASSSEITAVIKANAYGHGMLFVASVLDPLVEAFAVATLEEALVLRQHYPDKPITLLSGFFAAEQIVLINQSRFRPVIYNRQQLQWVIESGARNTPLALKLDSGMGRLGFRKEAFSEAHAALSAVSDDILLMSHFACADEPANALNQRQHEMFREETSSFQLPRSFSNSAAILTRPQDHYEQVRPGIMLYGASPLQGQHAADLNLKPVMKLNARVLDTKKLEAGDSVGYGARWRADVPCQIGVVSIGYGDGYPRVVNAKAQLSVAGVRYPLVGRVSMDSLAFLIDDEKQIDVGTSVELWGETIAVDEVADWAGTIAYELCCKVGERVTRIET